MSIESPNSGEDKDTKEQKQTKTRCCWETKQTDDQQGRMTKSETWKFAIQLVKDTFRKGGQYRDEMTKL